MARTPAQTQALIKKAVASDNKSEGMRSLFDAGLSVAEVREAFGAPYGYVYGVATRWANATGNAIPVAERETKNVTPAAKTTKAKAAPAAKATAKTPARGGKVAAPKAKATARRAAAKA